VLSLKIEAFLLLDVEIIGARPMRQANLCGPPEVWPSNTRRQSADVASQDKSVATDPMAGLLPTLEDLVLDFFFRVLCLRRLGCGAQLRSMRAGPHQQTLGNKHMVSRFRESL